MEKKLKIGIVGCGSIFGGAHFPGYLNMDNVEVVAFCDIIVERAEKFAKEYAEKKNLDKTPAVFEKYEDMIKMEGIEAVDICTPNYLHPIVAIAAFEHGLHVICEKPDAPTVAEAEAMKAASEKAGKVLMVIRNNRFRPTMKYLKERVESGKMGEIYAARCGWQRRRGAPPLGSWFSNKKESGGGPLIDLGVHMIDLAMWIMGNPTPVSVTGSTYQKFGNASHRSYPKKGADAIFDVEDLAMAFVRFDNGACLQVEVSWASNVKKEDVFIELRGDKEGAAHGNRTDHMLKIFGQDGEYCTDLTPYIHDQFAPPAHEGNLRHFVDVINGDAEPIFEPQQGVNMVKILNAIYESAETGREVKL